MPEGAGRSWVKLMQHTSVTAKLFLRSYTERLIWFHCQCNLPKQEETLSPSVALRWLGWIWLFLAELLYYHSFIVRLYAFVSTVLRDNAVHWRRGQLKTEGRYFIYGYYSVPRYMVCWVPGGGGGGWGGTLVFFGWVFFGTWYPVLEMGLFFIPRSRNRPKTDTLF